MTPEPFVGANVLLRAPENWDTETYGPCPDLPVARNNGMLISVWRPTQPEIALLVGGGVVVLRVAGTEQPAVQIEVTHTREANDGLAQA